MLLIGRDPWFYRLHADFQFDRGPGTACLNPVKASDDIQTCRRWRCVHGYGLSIDDYGTGYSSMLQLSRVPFTELKIDRSFVHGAHASTHLRGILQSSIEMAGRLGLTCVAEGVELREDRALLQTFGCDIGQGWLVGRAMRMDEFPGWLRENQGRFALLGT
jgi:EAL domain-containing protein (putative c-di-GMP-specific phosphodiesterase class I)